MGRGGWWAAVLGVTKSRTRLSGFPFTFTADSRLRRLKVIMRVTCLFQCAAVVRIQYLGGDDVIIVINRNSGN